MSAKGRRPFDPSDRAAAELQLHAKFGKREAEEVIAKASEFVLLEEEPWHQHVNDKRLERFDSALKALIDAVDGLPEDLRTSTPPEPRPGALPAELRDALERFGREVDFSEEMAVRGLFSDEAEADKVRAGAYANLREANRMLGLVPVNQFRHILSAWRAALRIEGNEPDPDDPHSVLAAQGLRVRFAVDVAFPWVERPDIWIDWPEVSGRDLALLAIVSGLETYPASAEFDALVDAWKKARSRAMTLLKEFESTDDVAARRHRAARRVR